MKQIPVKLDPKIKPNDPKEFKTKFARKFNSFPKSQQPDIPIGSSIVDDEQFAVLEKVFNKFY